MLEYLALSVGTRFKCAKQRWRIVDVLVRDILSRSHALDFRMTNHANFFRYIQDASSQINIQMKQAKL